MAELATQMGGKGKVAILAGNQNAPNLRKRVEGVQDEAAKHPGIKIVGIFYHVETPQDAAAEVIRVQNAHPDIQGWAMVGGWPLFTQTLLTDLDPSKVKIVAVDALPRRARLRREGPGARAAGAARLPVGRRRRRHDLRQAPRQEGVPPDRSRWSWCAVTRTTSGTWARQLRDWGFTDVPREYLEAEVGATSSAMPLPPSAFERRHASVSPAWCALDDVSFDDRRGLAATRCAARTARARARWASCSAGIYAPDAGRLLRATGTPVRFAVPRDALAAGIGDGPPGARVLRQPVGRREPVPGSPARAAAVRRRAREMARRARAHARARSAPSSTSDGRWAS